MFKTILGKISQIGISHAPNEYINHKIQVTNITTFILGLYGIPYLILVWFAYPFFVNLNLCAFVFILFTFLFTKHGHYTISRYLIILNVAILNHYAHIILVQHNEPLLHGFLVQQFMLVTLPFLFFDKREKYHLIASFSLVFLIAISTHLTKGLVELPTSISTKQSSELQIGSYVGIAIYAFVIYLVQSEAYRVQKNVIESLKQSEGSLRIAQNLADIVYWEVDLNTLKAKIGTKLLQNAGYPINEEFIEIYIPEFRKKYIVPEDHEKAIDLHRRVEENKNIPDYEDNTTYRIKGMNGEIFYHYCFVRILESNGTPILFVAVQDITKQQETLNYARIRERSINLSTKVGKLSYWQLDSKGNITLGTELLRNAGYDIKENKLTISLNECMQRFCLPEDTHFSMSGEEIAHAVNIKKNTEDIFSYLYRIKGIDGKIYYHKSYGRASWEDGELIIYGVSQDITEEQESILALRKNEASLKLSQQIAKIVYWEVDFNTLVMQFDNQLLINAGYIMEPGRISISKPDYMQKYIHPDDHAQLKKACEKALAKLDDPDFRFECTYRLIGTKGNIRYLTTVALNRHSDKRGTFFGITQDVTERYENYEILRKNEARLKLAQEINRTVYWEIDIETRILKLENRLLLLAGYDFPEGIITIPLQDFASKYMHQEDAKFLMQTFAYGLTQLNNPDYGFEKNVRMIGANGDTYYHRIAFYTRHQTTKGIIFGSTQDVTSQVKEEQDYILALRKNEASLKLSQQIAQIVHWEWEAEIMKLHFDNQLLINAGYAMEPGILSMSSTEYIQKFVHPEDHQKLFNSQTDTQTKIDDPNVEIEITYRLIGPSGNIRYHNVVALNRYNDNKGVFFGIFQDVTERYENIETLKKNEAALKLAQEMNKTVYWELNTESLLLQIDSRLLTLAGYDMPPGIMTIPIHDVIQNYIHPEDAPAMMEATAKALTKLEDPNFTFESTYRIFGAKGDIYYHHSVFNIRHQTTKSILFGVTQDVTSQARSEQQLLLNQKELLESQRKAAEYQLAALRSQMNPHFIFNCLNSIQNFIAKNDKYNAINYLSKFAKLIRLILEGSKDDYILLADEMKLLEYYVELEKMRFPDKFDFKMEADINLHSETLKIPPMLIQPFIENAILHGLVHKKDKGLLTISFSNESDKLICTIKDNGIGREEAERIKASKINTHKSVAMHLTRERLETHNHNTTGTIDLKITDLQNENGEGNGTLVEILLPLK